jgi:hypothetical protein
MNKGLMVMKWTVICVLFVSLFGWVTMFLWNYLVPPIFKGPEINFWQALGLLLLSKILFGGIGGKRWGGHGHMQWKQRYYDKLSNMSQEERERFKTRMREKWCYREKDTSGTDSGTSNV